jgi:hypothetical protein
MARSQAIQEPERTCREAASNKKRPDEPGVFRTRRMFQQALLCPFAQPLPGWFLGFFQPQGP